MEAATHRKAEREFDRQAGVLLDHVVTLAVAVILCMAAGWGIGVILAWAL